MAAELIMAPEAEQDVAEAYGWYDRRRTGLGEDFLSCVDACIQGICRAPKARFRIQMLACTPISAMFVTPSCLQKL